MNVNHKLELLDQLDDAAFALMMDEYSEAEGERLRAEFEADMRAGLTPPKPEGLDEKCRRQIRAEYGRARRAEYGIRVRKMAVKAAAMVLIVIGIAAATVMSVEALRTPVLNFFIEQYEHYSSLQLNSDEPSEDSIIGTEFLLGLLPEGYYKTSDTSVPKVKISMYENALGEIVQFSITQTDGGYNIDSEDALISEIVLGEYKGLLLEEDGYQAIWYDAENGIVYNLRATGLERDMFLSICNSLATYYN